MKALLARAPLWVRMLLAVAFVALLLLLSHLGALDSHAALDLAGQVVDALVGGGQLSGSIDSAPGPPAEPPAELRGAAP